MNKFALFFFLLYPGFFATEIWPCPSNDRMLLHGTGIETTRILLV